MKAEQLMKKNIPRIAVCLFLTGVMAISLILILKKDDINTDNSDMVTDAPLIETSVEATISSISGYGHDIDFAEPPNSEDDAVSSVTTVPDETESSDESATTSRTVITSRQRKEYDSNAVYIDMENILQNPELPVGCEITSLTMLLRFYGFDAEKTDMAKNYLPISWGNNQTIDGKLYRDSFFDYFIGDPFSRGYGCFSPAIEKAANKYISENGGGYTVKNISGCHPDLLYEYLIAGTPVLCWATDGMIEPEYYESWYDNATGEKLDWYLNEHCFILAGFNIANSTVTLNDPMKGIIDYNIDKFEVRFKQMYSQAIVLIPDGNTEITLPAVTEAAEEITVATVEAIMENETAAGNETYFYEDDDTIDDVSEPDIGFLF